MMEEKPKPHEVAALTSQKDGGTLRVQHKKWITEVLEDITKIKQF